jgi:sugar phosphate isomerase/epimerase
MKLAISNIAWSPDEDKEIGRILSQYGVNGVEIAPTKIWSKPLEVTNEEIDSYARFWRSRGIKVSSMQALLFGRPDLAIFGTREKRSETLAYLKGIIRLGGRLGAEALVFGSPKNRLRGELNQEQALEIAAEFFREIGRTALQHETVFCIEPNPVAYGCDFITTSAEGRELVAKVDQAGFGLHLDAAAMTMSHEDVEPELSTAIPGLCHFHISEPDLQTIGTGGVDHKLFAQTLRNHGYIRWCSVEMRASGGNRNKATVEEALEKVKQFYF